MHKLTILLALTLAACGADPTTPTDDAAQAIDARIPLDPSGSGSITALPERWFQDSVPVTEQNQAMQQRVSADFTDIQMIRPGFLAGINWRLTRSVTAGSVTVQPTINGTPRSLFGTSSPNGSPSGGSDRQSPDPEAHYEAGDTVGVFITTSGLAPITNQTIEVWLEVQAE